MPIEPLDSLIDEYLLGEADERSRRALEELLRSDATARRRLFEHLLLEALLYRAHTADAAAAEPLQASHVVSVFRRRWLWYGAAAAAVLLVACSLLVMHGWSGREVTSHNGYAIVSGQITVEGSSTQTLGPGARMLVAGKTPATLSLPDGSRAELEQQTRLTLRGPVEGVRQVLDLEAGVGHFTVTSGAGRFRVTTAIGSVTVLGTDFTVRMLEGSPRSMAVDVREGRVSVDQAGKETLLTAGQSRSFSEREAPRESTLGGQITRIDGQSITLTTGGADSKDIVLTINDQTKVRVESAEMVPGDAKEGATQRKAVEDVLSDLKVGQRISATFAGGMASSITVKYVAPAKSPER